MPDCIFCKIVSGEIPCHKVYEDKNFLAFLDIRPLNPGHAQVIPKKHYRWVFDVPDFGEYFEVARKVGQAAMKVLGANAFSLVTLGFEIQHAHIWVIPRFDDDGHGNTINWMAVKNISEEQMKEIARKMFLYTSKQ